jgi:DNA repair/transcription protein MET18/MMS19
LQAAEMVCSSRDDPRRLQLLKMIACVVNKEKNEHQMTTFVKSVVHDQWTSKHDHDRRKESFELLAWLAKALALRTHALAYELIQVILDLLLDEKWGKDAAKSFQTITSDDDLLNKSNHAVIRLLHKQRFFNFVFPKLVQHAKAVEDEGHSAFSVVADSRFAIKLSDCPFAYHR